MRGPMVGNVVTQLVTTTDWGDLDYLVCALTTTISCCTTTTVVIVGWQVLDLPPGTGDIQLSLCQTVNLDASGRRPLHSLMARF